MGCKVFHAEWNSSDLVRGATKRGKRRHLLSLTTFSLVHATDFADRYIFTSFSRDRARRCDRDWLRRLCRFAAPPDITLYFRLPLETAMGRILAGHGSSTSRPAWTWGSRRTSRRVLRCSRGG